MDTLELARRIRVHAVKMVNRGGSSHIGSVLSISDILAVLYGRVLQYKSDNPTWKGRDRFILSKGHAGAGVYAALAESGFFDVKKLMDHYQNGSIFSGHVSHKGVPGVEFSTGSLGHGLPVASGMAYAAKLDNKMHKVYCLMSDGELGEGSNWEAMLFASHNQLDNLIIIIDRNKLQSMKNTEDTLKLEPLPDKFKSFGWDVSVVDGHSHESLITEFKRQSILKKPKVIIANTTKGKGVSFMENSVEWHYKTPLDSKFRQALKELGELL
jgi:transketolase